MLGLAVTARGRPSGATAIKNGSVFDAKWPATHYGGGVRDTASFLTTLDSFDDPRGLGHVQLTFYALKPTGPMNCEPRELTRPRRGRSGPIYAQNFEIAAVIA